MKLSGYQQYKEQSMSTMTQGELLCLLYDEILKRLLRAELSIKSQEFTVFDASIKRCVEIVMHLKDTLDYQYPISRELARMYDFFLYEFSRISASREVSIIKEVRPLVEDLRDAYRQIQ